MAVKKAGVVGCGLMGSGIALVCAQAGIETWVREVDPPALTKGLGRIRKFLEDGVAKGKVATADKNRALGSIQGTTRLEDLASCDLVVEAVTEHLPLKREIVKTLDRAMGPSAVIASNTSSLSIKEIAAAASRPERVLGLHFFNPVPLMKLVEIIRAPSTGEAAFATATGFLEQIGKTAVTAKDTPGFVVNRLLIPYLLDAVRLLESGTATREDIDNGMKLGCGHPMGPLALLDFVGLDTAYSIANIMFEGFHQPQYEPPPLLKRMVMAGDLGRKSGRGFYEYAPET